MDFNVKRKVVQIEKQKQFLLDDKSELCLSNILNTEGCIEIIGECREFRERIYTPFKTICRFIKQVISSDKSCKKAVAGLVVESLVSEKKVLARIQGLIVKLDNVCQKERLKL